MVQGKTSTRVNHQTTRECVGCQRTPASCTGVLFNHQLGAPSLVKPRVVVTTHHGNVLKHVSKMLNHASNMLIHAIKKLKHVSNMPINANNVLKYVNNMPIHASSIKTLETC